MKTHSDIFDAIYKKFNRQIVGYISRYVGIENAEDVAQNAFMRICRRLETSAEEIQNEKAWVYKIATNTAIDFLRKKQIKLVDESSVELDNDRLGLSSEKESPMAQYVRKAGDSCVRSLVLGLPEKYGSVLILKDMEGFKNTEIAEILGISLASVKMRLHRGREMAQHQIRKKCDISCSQGGSIICEEKEA